MPATKNKAKILIGFVLLFIALIAPDTPQFSAETSLAAGLKAVPLLLLN